MSVSFSVNGMPTPLGEAYPKDGSWVLTGNFASFTVLPKVRCAHRTRYGAEVWRTPLGTGVSQAEGRRMRLAQEPNWTGSYLLVLLEDRKSPKLL